MSLFWMLTLFLLQYDPLFLVKGQQQSGNASEAVENDTGRDGIAQASRTVPLTSPQQTVPGLSFLDAAQWGRHLYVRRCQRPSDVFKDLSIVMGMSEPGQFSFNLNRPTIAKQDGGFMEIVFSPADRNIYQSASSIICTYHFCKPNNVCWNLTSTTIVTDAIFHTVPISLTKKGKTTDNTKFRGIVNLLSISCENLVIDVTNDLFKPQMIFFASQEQAIEVNMYKALGLLEVTSQINDPAFHFESMNEIEPQEGTFEAKQTSSFSTSAMTEFGDNTETAVDRESEELERDPILVDVVEESSPLKLKDGNVSSSSTESSKSRSEVPVFLRAVLRGHRDRIIKETAWNMTASTGEQDTIDKGHFWFNLGFIHWDHHRFVEVVFSPANSYTHHKPQGQCTFELCKRNRQCSSIVSNTVIKNDLFHTHPINYTALEISTDSVKLVSVICDNVTIEIADGDRKPLLVFFKTIQRAHSVNMYAANGWKKVRTWQQALVEEPNQQRGASSGQRLRRSIFSGTDNRNCTVTPFYVEASDFGEEGNIIEPRAARLNIGKCSGSCTSITYKMPWHLPLMRNYNKHENRIADIPCDICIATEIKLASVLIKPPSPGHFLLITKHCAVSACECR